MKTGFSIKSLNEYTWPVDVQVPTVNPETGEGEFETHRFTGKFKHLSKTQLAALVNGLAMSADDLTAAMGDTAPSDPTYQFKLAEFIADREIDLYMGLFVGWGDDLTEDGHPIPYSDGTKRQLLEEKIIREAVKKAHRDSQAGEAVRVKN